MIMWKLPQNSRSTVTYVIPVIVNCSYCTPDDGRGECPKHVEWSCNKKRYHCCILLDVENEARNQNLKFLTGLTSINPGWQILLDDWQGTAELGHSGRKLYKCHFLHQNPRTYYLGMNVDLHGENSASTGLNWRHSYISVPIFCQSRKWKFITCSTKNM
jgi:hypothetical protein